MNPRILYDHNLLPFNDPGTVTQKRTSLFLQSLGFTPSTIAGNGTFNQSENWSDQDGNLLTRLRPGTITHPITNRNEIKPPSQRAAKAMAHLALKPDTFGDPVAGPIPLVIDLEGPEAPSGQDAVNLVHWIEQVMGEDRKLYWYGWPQWSQGEPYDKILRTIFSGPCITMYNWDQVIATNGDDFYKFVRESNELITQRMPLYEEKIAFVFPYQQVYFSNSSQRVKDQNNIPVPLDRWREQIGHLWDDGWTIFDWMGYGQLDPVIAHHKIVQEISKR